MVNWYHKRIHSLYQYSLLKKKGVTFKKKSEKGVLWAFRCYRAYLRMAWFCVAQVFLPAHPNAPKQSKNNYMKSDIENIIQTSFDKQLFMQTLGAELVSVKEGEVIIKCNYDKGLTQQDGFIHAGALTSIVDSACGYAALTMMPKNSRVLSVEFKVNLLRPMNLKKWIAVGKVIKSGKLLSVCEGIICDEKRNKEYVRMIATMVCLELEKS